MFDTQTEQYKGILILGDEVTKQREEAAQSAHIQKLESIGELAAGIAHEINTPIQYIGNNTSFIGDGFKDIMQYVSALENALDGENGDPDTHVTAGDAASLKSELDIDYIAEEIPLAVEQSVAGINRVANIVGAMKTFAHPETDAQSPVNLNEILETVVTISTNEWKYIATVNKNFDQSIAPVLAYQSDLHHALLNIIVNAAHAISEKFSHEQSTTNGIIEISTNETDQFVEIHISDNGLGVPDDLRKRIFDPFFTTKQVGKGTGQGLAIAHAAIVSKHGGQLEIGDSTLGGAEFILRIPRSDQ